MFSRIMVCSFLAFGWLSGCSTESFQASNSNGANAGKGNNDAATNLEADQGGVGNGTEQGEASDGRGNDASTNPNNSTISIDDGVTTISFSDPSKAIMFRGTRGINLREKSVGILLNQNDEKILEDSGGYFLASGLRTGSNFNDWGFYVKAIRPIATDVGYVERISACHDNEIVVGLPDRGVDATLNNQSAVAGWQNRFICASITSKFNVKETVSLNYTHSFDLSVDCPGDSVMSGYDCGTCAVPSPAVLTCVTLERADSQFNPKSIAEASKVG